MSDILIFVSLGIVLVLFLLSSLIYHKLRIWKLLLLLLLAAVYVAINYFNQYIDFLSVEQMNEYFEYYLYFHVILFAITFKNKIKITQNLTDYDFFELEKELDTVKNASDLLRMRFISTIGLLNEGLIFYEDDLTGLFLTSQASEILETVENQFSMEDYLDYIHPEDQQQYLHAIKKVNKKNPNYEIKYRVKRKETFVWVLEKGKMFIQDKKQHLIASIKGLDIKLFPDTGLQELDSLPKEEQLTSLLIQERKEKKVFYLVMIHLTNIPDINKRFGRDVGNLMIAEYIKKMRYHFAREANSIFRLSGIQFALIINDEKKYDVLKRALVSGGELINLRLTIGGIQQMVYPNVGILKNDPWVEYEIQDFIALANKTLDEAIRNEKHNFSIFGE